MNHFTRRQLKAQTNAEALKIKFKKEREEPAPKKLRHHTVTPGEARTIIKRIEDGETLKAVAADFDKDPAMMSEHMRKMGFSVSEALAVARDRKNTIKRRLTRLEIETLGRHLGDD